MITLICINWNVFLFYFGVSNTELDQSVSKVLKNAHNPLRPALRQRLKATSGFGLLPLRNVEDLLHERGIDVSHEAVRFWWHKFGPMFAAEIRKRRLEGMKSSRWRWHLDEMFVKTNGERHYLWRAVDQ